VRSSYKLGTMTVFLGLQLSETPAESIGLVYRVLVHYTYA
jgi:hypothetical protein